MTPVGFHVVAQCRDLVGRPIENRGDRAVVDAGGNRDDLRRPQTPYHLFRHQRRGDVDFVHGNAQQGIAHGAADDARLAAVRRQHRHHLQEFGLAHPVLARRIQPGHAATLSAKLTRIAAVAPQMR